MTYPPAGEPTAVTRRSPISAFRTDIEGLRGVAVIAVVLYHAGVPFMSGGYVGVDVFFVLSGFLITGLIVDERKKLGSVRIAAFFARRVRRLLPASTLVFVSTVVLAAWLLSPLQVKDLAAQSKAVAVFGSNIWFSAHATDYLRPEAVSPFQQYWSLAVEEQFYLVWPFLVLLVCVGARHAKAIQRRVLVALGVLVAVSFVLAVWLTEVRQPSAFFLLHARAWELGAGGLLAVALRHGLRARRRVALPLGWIGLAAMVAPMVLYSDATKFPGWTALVPVVGTLAVLLAGSSGYRSAPESPRAVTTALSVSPLRAMGRYSYSLYLWHWPLLVIFATRAGGQSTPRIRVLIVAASVALAVLTFHLVENRVRFTPALVKRPAASLAVAVPLLTLSLLSTTLLTRAGTIEPIKSENTGVVAGQPTSFVPKDLTPSLEDARSDTSPIYHDGCHHSINQAEPSGASGGGSCRYAHIGGARVVLAGDSHAGHWFAALRQASDEHGWELDNMTKSTCPMMQVSVYIDTLKRDYTECDRWRDATLREIEADPPQLVVLAQKAAYYDRLGGRQVWLEGMRTTVQRLAKVAEVVVLRDTPYGHHEVPDCVSVHLEDVKPCEFDVTKSDRDLAAAERAVVEAAGGHYVDPVGLVCPRGHCPVIVGNILVFKDRHHLTQEFSKTLADPLSELLLRVWTPTEN